MAPAELLGIFVVRRATSKVRVMFDNVSLDKHSKGDEVDFAT